MKLPFQIGKSALAIALISFNITSCFTTVSAANFSPSSVRFTPPQPPDMGTPTGRRKGGASRGICPEVQLPLTALVPSITENLAKGPVTYVWGQTIVEHPTFWFYVPYSNGSHYPTEFVLQDDDDNDIYQTSVILPKQPGIVSVHLPSASTPLKTGMMYRWSFRIYCDLKKSPPPVSVEGGVQRIDLNPTLKKRLEVATLQQRVALYAANGIWFDALTTLAELRLVKPDEKTLRTDWSNLLQSIGLKEIAAQPLTNCCRPK